MINISELDLYERSRLFARLCHACYFGKTKCHEICDKELCIPRPTIIEAKHAYCMVYYLANDIVIVNRGVNDDADKLAVLKCLHEKTPVEGGFVHKGFLGEAERLMSHLPKSFSTDKRTLWITGFSLGGAIALIMASTYFPKEVHTFGSPRVGNTVWVNSLKDIPHYRFVNNNDFIPRIPRGFYEHHGTEIYITYNGKLLKQPKNITKFIDRVKGHLLAYLVKQDLWDFEHDHYIGYYYKHIDKFISK